MILQARQSTNDPGNLGIIGGNSNGAAANGSDNNQGWFISPFYPAVLGIIIIIILLFLLNFLHYRYRARRGLPPLFYQRCFTRRFRNRNGTPRWPVHEHSMASTSRSDGHQHGRLRGGGAGSQRRQADDGYDMENLQAPPPAYDPTMGPPPKYPEGATAGEEAKRGEAGEATGAGAAGPGVQSHATGTHTPEVQRSEAGASRAV